MPQLTRNRAARDLYTYVTRKYPDADKAELREYVNAIALEELRILRKDVLDEARRSPHYHVQPADPSNVLIRVGRLLAMIDHHIAGEP